MPCKNAPLTEGNLPSQFGKVFIVTGGSAGLGKILARILYQRHATVYIAARSAIKSQAVIDGIVADFPESKGSLTFLHLDLNDLITVKASAAAFLARESRLDVLWNNAGIMCPPEGSVTAQGLEQQLGVNTLAPFLFTLLLKDVLVRTAQQAPPNSVRVAWVSSIASMLRPKLDLENFDNLNKNLSQDLRYARAKSGNCVHAVELQRRLAADGVVSVAIEPGVHITELQRDHSSARRLMSRLMSSPPEEGAYTELYAGLSPDITTQTTLEGQWVRPLGKAVSMKSEWMDANTGRKYWDWTYEQISPYF